MANNIIAAVCQIKSNVADPLASRSDRAAVSRTEYVWRDRLTVHRNQIDPLILRNGS